MWTQKPEALEMDKAMGQPQNKIQWCHTFSHSDFRPNHCLTFFIFTFLNNIAALQLGKATHPHSKFEASKAYPHIKYQLWKKWVPCFTSYSHFPWKILLLLELSWKLTKRNVTTFRIVNYESSKEMVPTA